MVAPNLSQYDYFLFDWDGCLAMTLHATLRAHRDSFADFGAHPTDSEIAAMFGDEEAPEHFGIKEVEACWEAFFTYLGEAVKEVELYEGARDTLAKAQAHGKVAVVSSQSRDILTESLARHKLEDVFDHVLSGNDVENYKPHPEAIEKALVALGGDARRAVMFGDSDKDVRAANAAGVDSVLLFPDEHELFYDFDKLKSHNPTHIAKGMHEVRAWF